MTDGGWRRSCRICEGTLAILNELQLGIELRSSRYGRVHHHATFAMRVTASPAPLSRASDCITDQLTGKAIVRLGRSLMGDSQHDWAPSGRPWLLGLMLPFPALPAAIARIGGLRVFLTVVRFGAWFSGNTAVLDTLHW